MRKPKLNLGQVCYFALLGCNAETGNCNFVVNSAKVKGIDYDSETDSFNYYVESMLELADSPNWLHRVFPKKLWICRLFHQIYHDLHKSHISYLNETEVFHDIRDCIEDSHDIALTLEENRS